MSAYVIPKEILRTSQLVKSGLNTVVTRLKREKHQVILEKTYTGNKANHKDMPKYGGTLVTGYELTSE